MTTYNKLNIQDYMDGEMMTLSTLFLNHDTKCRKRDVIITDYMVFLFCVKKSWRQVFTQFTIYSMVNNINQT